MFRPINANIYKPIDKRRKRSKGNLPDSDNLKSKINQVVTSTAILIFCFISANLILDMAIALAARLLQYQLIPSYNHVAVLPFDGRYWSVNRVIAIYLTAPLVCISGAMVLFSVLRKIDAAPNSLRLFLFWLMICLSNIFLTHLLYSPLGISDRSMVFYHTFAIVGTWLGIKMTYMALFSVLAIAGSFLVGAISRGELLKFSSPVKLMKAEEGKNGVVYQLYLVPLTLAAVPLICLSTRVNLWPTVLTLFNLAFIAFAMIITNSNPRSRPRGSSKDALGNFTLGWVLVTAGLWIVVFKFIK